jgi:transcriptional regulator with XRE-family HTH domain
MTEGAGVAGTAGDNDLGGNLRRIRVTRGLTQEQLAVAAGTIRSQIASLETGRISNPGVYSLYPIALALGVTFEALMGVGPLADSTKARVTRKRENFGPND